MVGAPAVSAAPVAPQPYISPLSGVPGQPCTSLTCEGNRYFESLVPVMPKIKKAIVEQERERLARKGYKVAGYPVDYDPDFDSTPKKAL